ncbi:hypothetical protein AMAG_19172 [Allomyces macrogynus ATCC 38327]|uniref:Uncharacterized protein n=1 Tax=Allomyces macrogynus (strain ATCC 38327) TaxID=578462 RepID=A0A0L0SPT1_ALLM3|nr:hypothetical protein AMAG_19172 [Allomyces macrogynus ATCC 38327]|eukprot:KNE64496.1 hypothetical protein AMAG_19172 [Allomyces macrogynus ATCC 38327]
MAYAGYNGELARLPDRFPIINVDHALASPGSTGPLTANAIDYNVLRVLALEPRNPDHTLA